MFDGNARIVAALILGLSLLLLGRPPQADEQSAGNRSAILLAQNSRRLGQKAQSAVFDQLTDHGAKMVEYSQVRDLVNRGKRSGGGVACVGGKQCLILIENFGDQCKSFRCGNDHGTPVCWCDT